MHTLKMHFLKKYVLQENHYEDIRHAQINPDKLRQADIDPDENDFAEGENAIFINNEFADDERESDGEDDENEQDDEDASES